MYVDDRKRKRESSWEPLSAPKVPGNLNSQSGKLHWKSQERLRKIRHRNEITALFRSYTTIKQFLASTGGDISPLRANSEFQEAFRSLVDGAKGCIGARRLSADLVFRYLDKCPDSFQSGIQSLIRICDNSVIDLETNLMENEQGIVICSVTQAIHNLVKSLSLSVRSGNQKIITLTVSDWSCLEIFSYLLKQSYGHPLRNMEPEEEMSRDKTDEKMDNEVHTLDSASTSWCTCNLPNGVVSHESAIAISRALQREPEAVFRAYFKLLDRCKDEVSGNELAYFIMEVTNTPLNAEKSMAQEVLSRNPQVQDWFCSAVYSMQSRSQMMSDNIRRSFSLLLSLAVYLSPRQPKPSVILEEKPQIKTESLPEVAKANENLLASKKNPAVRRQSRFSDNPPPEKAAEKREEKGAEFSTPRPPVKSESMKEEQSERKLSKEEAIVHRVSSAGNDSESAGRGADVGDRSKHIWVGNIDESVRDDEIIVGFSRFGEIENFSFARHKCCCFITYRKVESAVAAVTGHWFRRFGANVVKVQFQQDRSILRSKQTRRGPLSPSKLDLHPTPEPAHNPNRPLLTPASLPTPAASQQHGWQAMQPPHYPVNPRGMLQPTPGVQNTPLHHPKETHSAPASPPRSQTLPALFSPPRVHSLPVAQTLTTPPAHVVTHVSTPVSGSTAAPASSLKEAGSAVRAEEPDSGAKGSAGRSEGEQQAGMSYGLSKSGILYCQLALSHLQLPGCGYVDGMREPIGWPAKLEVTKRADYVALKNTFAAAPPTLRDACKLHPWPGADNKQGFQKFVAYLTERQRVGVVKINPADAMGLRILYLVPWSKQVCEIVGSPFEGEESCLLGLILPSILL